MANERIRQRNERIRMRNAEQREKNSEADSARSKRFSRAQMARLLNRVEREESVRERGEAKRQFSEYVRFNHEAKRQRLYQDATFMDKKTSRKMAEAEAERESAEMARVSREGQRIVDERKRARERAEEHAEWHWRHRRAVLHDRTTEMHERIRHASEKMRRMQAFSRESRFRDTLVALEKALSQIYWGEKARYRNELMRNRNDVHRGIETSNLLHYVMQKEAAAAARGEQLRGFAEDARRQAEAWRDQMTRHDWLEIARAIKDANRREEQARRNEEEHKKMALASYERLRNIASNANYSENWRALAEVIRKKREHMRGRESDSDLRILDDLTRKLHDEEVARNTAGKERRDRWHDLFARVSRVLSKSDAAQAVAQTGEGTREQQEARRAKETEEALKKLQAGEGEFLGDQASFDKNERERQQGENRRILELRQAIGKLTDGEHWLKGLEVSRWHHEMKRQEAERWRRAQAQLYATFGSKLTGNVTHDEKVRRWYEAQRAKNERRRLIRMKYLRGEALTEEEAAINDEAAREHSAQARVNIDGRIFHEAEAEDADMGREFTWLERKELARRRAEKARVQAEYQREDAEERRVKEIVKAVLGRVRPRPPGPQAPVEHADGSSCPGHPYCARRRRSHHPTMVSAAAASPVAVAAHLVPAMPPVVVSAAQRD